MRGIGWNPNRYFRYGNAGDVMAERVIENHYGCRSMNVNGQGGRLLVIGSIASRLRDGDVVAGIGVKNGEVPRVRCRVLGLRGPITYERFKKAGHDLSEVRFLKDPGLLIRFCQPKHEVSPKGRVFIPHYRERYQYLRDPIDGIRFVDIDNDPLEVARHILNAELVYTSSLHGVIFAHALNRPCVLVRTQTDEPWLKYEDYYCSIDAPVPKPLASIREASTAPKPDSPLDIHFEREEFDFPLFSELVQWGIAEGN